MASPGDVRLGVVRPWGTELFAYVRSPCGSDVEQMSTFVSKQVERRSSIEPAEGAIIALVSEGRPGHLRPTMFPETSWSALRA